MARNHGCQDRHFPGKYHSGATGKGAPFGRPSVSAPGGEGCRPGRSLVGRRFFEKVTGIADTGFLVAFGNRDDRHHHWAVHLAREVRARCQVSETSKAAGIRRRICEIVY